jgi:cyclase
MRPNCKGFALAVIAALLCVNAAQAQGPAADDAGTGPAALPAVQVLPVRAGLYMLTISASGINLALQSGPDGVVLVNPGPAPLATDVVAAIRRVTAAPLRYLIDTNADAELTGGNANVSQAGYSFIANQLGRAAPIIAQQNVLYTLLARAGANYSAWDLPSEVYSENRPQFNFYLNDQGIAVVWQPAAHSNGDSVVRFDGADVVVTGEVFDDTRFPIIDLAHGGSIQGEIDALNRLVNVLTFASIPLVGQPEMQHRQAGTLVIPLRGPICDHADLVTYRDMLVIVKDRIEDLMRHGRTLEQIEAADPTLGYRSRYGSDSGEWTTDAFVEAVYRSLRAGTNNRRSSAPTQERSP